MKSTAEYQAIVDELEIRAEVSHSQFLHSGFEWNKDNARLYRAAADAIKEFLDRENRLRENDRRQCG